VLCHEFATSNWYRLTPTEWGSYLDGTWSFDSSMQSGYAPFAFASGVLPDGRVIVEGGEYNCNPNCVAVWQTRGSIYDPVTRTWTAVSPPAGWKTIGDTPSVVLSDGTFMLGNCCTGDAAFFNPNTLAWTPVSGVPADNFNAEEGWTLLPNGTVLKVDVWPTNSRLSEVFDPHTQMWTSAGNTPVFLTDTSEIGPGVLRTDGTVFFFGANGSGAGHTAIYDTVNDTWSSGPDFPNGDDAADAPAALLPNGNALVQASPGFVGTPSNWYEIDKTTSSFTQVATPSYSFTPSSSSGQMLLLPTGQVLQTESSNDVRLYTSSGTYDESWRPAITSVPLLVSPESTYTISGTQFNGLSQGAFYGDDFQSATNYPIIRITNQGTGRVFYAKTHDHTSMGVATGSLPVSTSFDVPAGIELGTSDIEVVANGIPSTKTTINVGFAQGVALTVASTNANSGVSIAVTPNDSNGQSNGRTPFTRSHINGTSVTLTDLTLALGGNNFSSWIGCDSTSGSPASTCNVTMSADRTVTAIFVPQTNTLTVVSSNPDSGVSIAVAPNDNNGQSNGSTQFTRAYNNATPVTLVAPQFTADGNSFSSWIGCDSTSGSPATTCNVTMSADTVVTARYVTPLTPAALTLPSAEVNVPYTAPLVLGGLPPYLLSHVKGVFPSGLSFDTGNGWLTGTPGRSKGGSFAVRVTDAATGSVTGTFKITVVAVLSVGTKTLKAGTHGKAYTGALKAKGGKAPFAWSELTGNLVAAGLTLNASTGVISGIPPAPSAGPVNLTVQVTDQLGGSAQKNLTLTIK
jgi:hypothetical protein